MSQWSFIAARCLMMGLGWGVAWGVSEAVPTSASTATFYVIGGITTWMFVWGIHRELRRQRIIRSAMADTEPSYRVYPFIVGTFFVAVGLALGYFLRTPDYTFWSWVRWVVIAAPILFGLESLLMGLFGSDEKIRERIALGGWRPRDK
jgi:hypothetical protein